MDNVINIGSANIDVFGFQSFFNLELKKLTLDITGFTTFKSGGAANVVGIAFNITGPGGIILSAVDWTAPMIDPSTATSVDVDLPGEYGMFGFYSITGVIRDAGNIDYTTKPIIKEITQPNGYSKGFAPGVMSIDAQCNIPQVKVSEQTVFVYNSLPAISIQKTGILSYPKGTLADLDFTFTPLLISGSGKVFTGRYTVNNKSVASYDLNDGVIVMVSYLTQGLEGVVNCNSAVAQIMCCIEDTKFAFENNPYSATGKAAKEKLDRITIPFYTAIGKEASGKDASTEVAQIKAILNCDCGCNASGIEPQPILGATQLGNIIVVLGTNAVNVTPETAGSTTNFTVDVKNVILSKDPDDTNFTIVKTTSSSQIVYTVDFDYEILAATILDEIQNNEDLLQLLKNLVGVGNNDVSLDGLLNNCIYTLSNCSYSLIEQTNVPKVIVSVTINGVVKTAPTGLLLTNTSGIATWLNSLSLGTFTAHADSGSGTVIISSVANPNNITLIEMTANTGTISRLFTRTCMALIDILNAIGTYICALQSSQIKFGITGPVLLSFNSDFTIKTTMLSSSMTVGALLVQMLNSINALYMRQQTVSLNCANIKTLFAPPTLSQVPGDGVLGTIGLVCAKLDFATLSGILLTTIANTPALLAQLCLTVTNCTAPTCSAVTNVSAVFASGTLTVNCNNNGGGSTPIKIFYRVANSGGTLTEVDTTASALPLAIPSLATQQYEVQVVKQCSNGLLSPAVSAFSNNPCAAPASFGVTTDGTNFTVTGSLTGGATKIRVVMIAPGGGTSTYNHDFGSSSGSFTIPVPASTFGDFNFTGYTVCDDTVSPNVVSNASVPVVVNISTPSSDAINARLNTNEAGACAASPRLIFVSPGTVITPGNVLYYNFHLTIVISDMTFVVDDATGRLYNLASNGVVGSELSPC